MSNQELRHRGPAPDCTGPEESGGLPLWLWGVIAVGASVPVVLIAALVLKRAPSDADPKTETAIVSHRTTAPSVAKPPESRPPDPTAKKPTQSEPKPPSQEAKPPAVNPAPVEPTPPPPAPSPPQPEPPPEDSSPLIPDPHFGICLGQDADSVERDCKKAGIVVHKKKDAFAAKDYPGDLWLFSGALNGSEAIASTSLSIVDGRVAMINVEFKDATRANYDVLASALDKKYGKSEETLPEFMAYSRTYHSSVNGKGFMIELKLETGEIRNHQLTNTLTLRYSHNQIVLQAHAEMEDRKSRRIEKDL